MMESFMLPVEFEGREIELETRIIKQGYIARFAVMVHEQEYFFERDEEGQFRAMLDTPSNASLSKAERELLKEICLTLNKL